MNLDLEIDEYINNTLCAILSERVEKDRKDQESAIEELSSEKIYEYNRRRVKVSDQDLQKKLQKQFTLAQTYLHDFIYDTHLFTPAAFRNTVSYVVWNTSQKLTAIKDGWVAALQGDRETMEDTFAQSKICVYRSKMIQLSLFDGHSGKGCASFLEKEISGYLKKTLAQQKALSDSFIFNVLKTTFVYLGDQYRYLNKASSLCNTHLPNKHFSGSTAITALIGKNTLWVANVGDSRAILIHSNGKVEALSNDHKPDREENRNGIIKRGGKIYPRTFSDVSRVKHRKGTKRFAVSRAVGHPENLSGINPRASIISYDLTKLSGSYNFFVIATDGFWDVISSTNAALTVRGIIRSSQKNSTTDSIEKIVAESLAEQAFRTCSLEKIRCDNITVMVVKLESNPPFQEVRKFQHTKTLAHKQRRYVHIRDCKFMCKILVLFFSFAVALSILKNMNQKITIDSR